MSLTHDRSPTAASPFRRPITHGLTVFFMVALLFTAVAAISALALPGAAFAEPCEDCGGGGGGGGGDDEGGGGGGGGGGDVVRACTYTGTYRFEPVSLKMIDQEDPWPDGSDELHMIYGDQDFTTTLPYLQTVPGWQMPQAIFTGTQMRLDLMEQDNGWLDHNQLGYAEITPGALCDQRDVDFNGPGWSYKLTYKVTAL